jgi:hypothetical protein
MKAATKLIVENKALAEKDPSKKKSIRDLVDKVNNAHGSSLAPATVARYVRNGHIGESPMKRGPVGDFPKPVYKALKGAYTTYLKLEQANGRKQSNIKALSKLVNATVNKAGHSKTREHLARKLQRETADKFDVGKANVMEQRRVMWTNSYNLDIWYTTWSETLVELGFARPKTDEDVGVIGELVFDDEQLRRIINMDETDGSIDDTTGQRGGRPAMVFHSSDVSAGATAVNKSGYSSTIICGSNAFGEPLPQHFQLKTTAQTAEKEKMSIEWFAHARDTIAQFGNDLKRRWPALR